MRKTLLRVLVLVIAIALSLTVVSLADSYTSSMKNLISTADTVVVETGASNSAGKIVGTVITAARIIGVCFAVVMLLTIAMKYMTAAAGDKADIKKSAVAYVVGAIVLFAVTGILGIIQQFAEVIS